MGRKLTRTVLVGLVSAAVLAFLVVPAADAVGRLLLLPAVFRPAARWMVAALWVTGVAAAWTYQPPESPSGEVGADEPSPTHPGRS